jgi:hypothetical protein
VATVITSTSPANMSSVQTTGTQTAPAALGASGGAYAQAEDQKLRDFLNDLRTTMINKGIWV